MDLPRAPGAQQVAAPIHEGVDAALHAHLARGRALHGIQGCLGPRGLGGAIIEIKAHLQGEEIRVEIRVGIRVGIRAGMVWR